jgi:hypothetical protein
MKHTPLLGVVALLALAAPAFGQTSVLKTTAQGNPQIKSINAITFAPGGVLLIGDSTGGQLVAVETGDTTKKAWTTATIGKIDEKLAARLGTTPKGIEIIKLAVNPASLTPYIAVRLLPGKKSMILTVDEAGKVNEFSLDNVKYARIKLDTGADKIALITDLAWADDRVLAALQAGKTFASRIVSVMAPLENDSTTAAFSTETFHVAHNKWETIAPIRTVIPYEEGGKKYLVGAFTCTPLVKYSLNDLKPGAKVKGESVIEVGNANTPRDMFVYEKGGKKYILMSTLRNAKFGKAFGTSLYWTVKLDFNILAEKEKINQKAVRRNEKANQYMVASYDGVTHMDLLDTERAMVVRQDNKGNVTLEAVPLP